MSSMSKVRQVHAVPLLLTLFTLVEAAAQSDTSRFQRRLEQIQRQTHLLINEDVPADQRALFEVGGLLNFSFFAIDDSGQSTHVLRQSELIGHALASFDGVHEFFLRGRTAYRDWNEGESFDGHGDDLLEPTLDRGTYRFDLQRAIGVSEGRLTENNLTIQGGRQLVHWVNGLTLSREIDGGIVTFSHQNVLELQMLAGLTRRSTADIDSSRPDFDGDTRRGFYGALLSVQAADQHRPFVYGLVQQDRNSDRTRVELILDPDGIPGNADDVNTRTRHAYDSHYVGFGSTGNLGDRIAYAAEFVYQGGEGLSASFDRNIGIPIAQTDERIEAYAMDLKIDYLFQDPNRTRAVGEVLLASGDDDRLHTTNTVGGNRRGSTDRAFNAFGLVNTGLAFAPPSSNLLMFRGGLATFPLPASTWFDRLQLGATFYSFFKLDREAPIDQATSKDAYLGFEVDLFANWQIASDVTLSLQYGVFLPGHAIAADHDARHFLVTSVTYSF